MIIAICISTITLFLVWMLIKYLPKYKIWLAKTKSSDHILEYDRPITVKPKTVSFRITQSFKNSSSWSAEITDQTKEFPSSYYSKKIINQSLEAGKLGNSRHILNNNNHDNRREAKSDYRRV